MRVNPISVCMATYNGSKYISEQLISILNEFNNEMDELIIIDDNSTDNTVSIIKGFVDKRIHLYINNSNLGVNKTFEKCIKLAQNEYIFLSDQDDIWIEGRIEIMLKHLQKGKYLLVNGNEEIFPVNYKFEERFRPLSSNDSNKNLRNLLKIFLGNASYFGCTMGFKKELTKYILPFPKSIESHDIWIVLTAIMLNKNLHIDNIVLKRRIHTRNASLLKRGIILKIYSRIIFIISVIDIIFRIVKNIKTVSKLK